jgi:hypothetical protein
MSIENFQNPWAAGGPLHPDWLGGEKVLGVNNNSQDANKSRKVDKNSKFYANCIDYPEKKWWVEWFDREGHSIYVECKKYGFSINGSLCVLAHAYKEQATTGRDSGYKTHNWWNFGPVKNRVPPQQKGESRWAAFSNIQEAVHAYIDRITSPSDLIEYKNPNFNPSFPAVGELFKKENLPSAKELDDAFRINGSYTYCGSGCGNYSADIISLVSKYVSPHFIDFLSFKINCIKNKALSKSETEPANTELHYYNKIIDQIEKRPK